MDILELATELHNLHCRNSHIDQCGWDYEKAYAENDEALWTKQHSAHASYLRWTKNVMEELPNYTPEQIIEVAKGIDAGMRSPYKGKW